MHCTFTKKVNYGKLKISTTLSQLPRNSKPAVMSSKRAPSQLQNSPVHEGKCQPQQGQQIAVGKPEEMKEKPGREKFTQYQLLEQALNK